MKLFRAYIEYQEDGGYDAGVQELDVIKETRCYYFVRKPYSPPHILKKVHKDTMKYAQKTIDEAYLSLIKRMETQVYWWEHRIDYTKKALRWLKNQKIVGG